MKQVITSHPYRIVHSYAINRFVVEAKLLLVRNRKFLLCNRKVDYIERKFQFQRFNREFKITYHTLNENKLTYNIMFVVNTSHSMKMKVF